MTPAAIVQSKGKPKEVRFSSKAHLLVELGERLVTKPEAAVAELVKNAYDADASTCWVSLEGDDLIIADNGHGMTEDVFVHHWMVVASDSKRTRTHSRYFKRPLAGSKGLGRLSVAYLGEKLELTSVSYDADQGSWMQLSASFDWNLLVEGDDLSEKPVTYTYRTIEEPSERRTLLRIKSLKRPWDEKLTKGLGTEVASLCDSQLIKATTKRSADFSQPETKVKAEEDPGFDVKLPSAWQDQETVGLQQELLSRTESTLHIKSAGGYVHYEVTTQDPEIGWKLKLPADLSGIGSLRGLIHYIPQENRRFAGLKTVDGRTARTWLRERAGVRVYYQGFRVFPYGSEKDDWLQVSLDLANSRRILRSRMGAKAILKRDEELKEVLGQAVSSERSSIMLHVPRSSSTLGSITIERDGPDSSTGLIPAANRQGFVENEAFERLHDIVRTGIEIMAAVRTELVFRKKKERIQERIEDLQEAFQEAIQRTRKDKDIPTDIKAAWVSDLRVLEKRVVDSQTEAVELATSFESVGLLGALAAFLTHEMTELLNDLQSLVKDFRRNKSAVSKLGLDDLAQDVEARVKQLTDQTEYVTLFMSGRTSKKASLKPRAQADLVIKRLDSQVQPRGITVENEIPANLVTSELPVTLLSGVLMNLYTNAVKWVIDEKNVGGKKAIRFDGEDLDDAVLIRVSDTGPGIDRALWQLVFLPGFTTVSKSNPFNTGMGMGLHIVKRLLGEIGGKIRIVSPMAGYSTTFEIRVPKGNAS